MTKISFTKLCLVILLIIVSFQCKLQKEITDERISIGIINPGVGSLRGFEDLIENDILNIENIQLIAICYEQAENNYSRVKDFIDSRDDQLFRFQLIKGELKPEDLYINNDLSDQFRKIVSETEGLFFLGGADVPPALYMEKTSLLTDIYTPHRHYFELSLLFHLLGGYQDTTFIPLLAKKSDYVVVGFCLGMQTINMATGGSMYQDIPSELYQAKYVEDVLELESDQQHKNYWQNLSPDDQMIWSNFHRIKQVNDHHFFDDRLWQNNPTPVVYSSHHQAVKKTGLNIEIIATSMDEKVPEIIAHTVYKNVLGVQYHPEVASLYHVDGNELKWFPDDTLRQTYHAYLQNRNSLYFHMKLWEKIGKLF
jgi:putative glutamine amidotransferase